MFALVTVLINFWGIRKSYYQKQTLSNMLLSKAAGKVMHYLKDHETVSEKEMREIVDGLSAGEFGSKAKAVVDGNREFTKALVESMLHDGMIEQAGQENGRPLYRKKK